MAAVKGKDSGGLATRVVTGLLLAVVALGLIWLGGWPFNLLIFAMVLIIFYEWAAMHRARSMPRGVGVLLTAATVLLASVYGPEIGLGAAGIGAVVLFAISRFSFRLSAGLLYACLPAIALIWLRGLGDGLILVLWAMLIVWATDIFAYFTGRTIGGPKIWRAISPNKTWSGLAGGVVAAGLVSVAVGSWAAWEWAAADLFLTGAVLAVIAQAGDFFESGLKRRAGVKDSGNILPGHGGVMDRVDGLVPVVCVVALLVACA